MFAQVLVERVRRQPPTTPESPIFGTRTGNWIKPREHAHPAPACDRTGTRERRNRRQGARRHFPAHPAPDSRHPARARGLPRRRSRPTRPPRPVHHLRPLRRQNAHSPPTSGTPSTSSSMPTRPADEGLRRLRSCGVERSTSASRFGRSASSRTPVPGEVHVLIVDDDWLPRNRPRPPRPQERKSPTSPGGRWGARPEA